MPPDWEDYRHVLALARAGTLSGAGERLGVVRTTVGRRLQAIEDQLGVRLFDRTPEGFVATAAGEELVAVAAGFEAELLAAEARVMGHDAQLQGGLRISTLDFVYDRYLDVFARFMARYPGITPTVCTTTERVSLRRREADLVLRLSDGPDPSLVGRRLTRLSFGLYASRELVDRVGVGAPLCAFPWISDDERSPDGWVDAWLAAHAPGAEVVLRYDSYAAVRASVRAGLGVHALPRFEAERDPTLVCVDPGFEIGRDLWVLTLAELRTNTRVRAFMDHVYAELGARDSARGGAQGESGQP